MTLRSFVFQVIFAESREGLGRRLSEGVYAFSSRLPQAIFVLAVF